METMETILPENRTNSPLGKEQCLNSIMIKKNSQSDEDSVCADIDRWASSSIEDSTSQTNDSEKIRELEEEHERLSESVLSLSTHFAQIQFRIQQINAAPSDQRNEMLKDLQEFASRSCIDVSQLKHDTEELKKQRQDSINSAEEKKACALVLINQLRSQLEDLERFAYENGHDELPVSELKQRQKLVFNKLQEKIQLKIELEKISEQELRKNVDEGIEQILYPMREKDKLVDQLQTQIIDLERYVAYLQQECATLSTEMYPIDFSLFDAMPKSIVNESTMNENKANNITSTSSVPVAIAENTSVLAGDEKGIRALQSTYRKPYHNQANNESTSLFSRFFGCRSQKFQRNELKRTIFCNHYGDQRARMELAVDAVVQVLQKYQILSVDRSERETLPIEQLNDTIFECSEEAIVAVVRKQFCQALKDLLEHGMRAVVAATSDSLLASFNFGCGSKHQSTYASNMKQALRKFDGKKLEHIWDIIQLFYESSRILEMRNEVVGRLSDAFKLDSIDGKTATSKQMLLVTIENVQSTHSRLQRSSDTMWKAFVSAALNHNRLPGWIRIIFRSSIILSKCYYSWAYVARTGCEDIRPLVERLHEYNFDLPVDLAVRPFEHIKEAF